YEIQHARDFLGTDDQHQIASYLQQQQMIIAASLGPLGSAESAGSAGARLAPSALARRAPRAAEGAVPTSGADMISDVVRDLQAYPVEIIQGMYDLAAQNSDRPQSEIASVIRRWMQENPVATIPDHPTPAQIEAFATGV